MGIILFPFIVAAFGTGLFSLIRSFLLLRSKKVGSREILWGMALSLILLGSICLSYRMQGRAWVFSSVFRIPIVMFIIPFGLYMITAFMENKKAQYLSKIFLLSVAISAILSIVFHGIFFELANYLGIETYN